MIKISPELSSLVEWYSEQELITSTTSTIYLDKLSLALIPIYSGNYMLNFYCETAVSLVAQRVFVKVIEGVNIYSEVCPPVKENYGNGQWLPINGFKQINLIKDNVYNCQLQFKTSGGTAYIRRARMNIRRVF